MKAMILAAGFGTRLFPLTIDRTKPAIPFLGKPLVGYVAEYIARFGINEVIVNLHHQPDSVKQALGDGEAYGVKIRYSEETPEILGTAGALDKVRDQLDGDTFLVVNGKIITDIDIAAALETHRRSGALATMVLKKNLKRERFTEVYEEGGFLTGFGDFPSDAQELPHPPLMFTGIQILEPAVFDYIPRHQRSDIVPVFYAPALNKGERIAVHIADGKWYELSTIPRYLDISLAMMDGKDVFHGRACSVESDAHVRQSILWDNVRVDSGAELARTIVGDNVRIPAGASFRNAAIVSADMVRNCVDQPEKASQGYFDGDNYIVPLN
jgi:NDP-sugar pyrophosphorylase family protein